MVLRVASGPEEWTVDVELISDAPKGRVVARFVLATEVDAGIAEDLIERRRLETAPTPAANMMIPTLITRSFDLRTRQQTGAPPIAPGGIRRRL